jgi:hypothetical protein
MKKALLIVMALCVFQTQGAENKNPSESALSTHKRVCSDDISECAKEMSDVYNTNMRLTGTNPFKTLSRVFHLNEEARLNIFTQYAKAGMSVEEGLYQFIKGGSVANIQSPHYSRFPTLFKLVEELGPYVSTLEHICNKRMRPSEGEDDVTGDDDQ